MKYALIVDDDEIFGHGMVSFIERLGYSCDFAQSVEDAVAQVDQAEQPYTIAFVDLLLPISTHNIPYKDDLAHGVEIIRHIKHTHPETGVVVITAYRWLFSHVAQLWSQLLNGVVGIEKGAPYRIYKEAIDDVLSGECQFYSSDTDMPIGWTKDVFIALLEEDMVPQVMHISKQLPKLDQRYKDILPYINWKPEYLAQRLDKSSNTIRAYKRDIYDILGMIDPEEQRDIILFLATIYARLCGEMK